MSLEDLSEQRTKIYTLLSTELWVCHGGGQKGEKTCLGLPIVQQSTRCDRQGQAQIPKTESYYPGQDSECLIL